MPQFKTLTNLMASLPSYNTNTLQMYDQKPTKTKKPKNILLYPFI